MGEENDNEALMAKQEGWETERGGWVEDNGELMKTGKWLRRAGEQASR